MTEKTLNVYQRLAEVRKAVPYLKKEQKGAQYQYVGSSDVLGSLHAKINEVGLMLIPEIVGHLVTSSERTNAKGNISSEYFTELEMTMTWVNIDDPSDTAKVSWYAQGVDLAGEKGVGKALTYAEKYFLLKTFNIATDKDDPDAFQEKIESKKATAKISDEQKNEMKKLAKEYAEMRGLKGEKAVNQALDWTLNQVSIKNLDNADAVQGEAAINLLNELISKHQEKLNAEKAAADTNAEQESLLEGRTTQPVNWGSK